MNLPPAGPLHADTDTAEHCLYLPILPPPPPHWGLPQFLYCSLFPTRTACWANDYFGINAGIFAGTRWLLLHAQHALFSPPAHHQFEFWFLNSMPGRCSRTYYDALRKPAATRPLFANSPPPSPHRGRRYAPFYHTQRGCLNVGNT